MERTVVRLQHERRALSPERLRKRRFARQECGARATKRSSKLQVRLKQMRVDTVRSLNPPCILFNPNHVEGPHASVHHPMAPQQHPPPACIRGQPTMLFPRVEVARHTSTGALACAETWVLLRAQWNAHIMGPCPRALVRSCCCWLPPAAVLPDEALIFGVSATKPDVPHRPDVYVSDAPRDDSVAPERRKRSIVVQKHGEDFALRHSS